MANFLGFKQVTLAEYNSLGDSAKKGYLWLVREKNEGGEVLSSSIYFGTRLYANTTDNELVAKVDNIVNTLGDAVDADGNFLGFLPIAEHEILGDESVVDFTAALSALEAAILENKAKVAELDAAVSANTDAIEAVAADVNALEEKVAELESAGTDVEEAIEEIKNDIADVKEDVADVKEDVAAKVEKAVEGTNGTAYIFNETDGGGAKFVNNDGTEAFVGVNDGGENGLMAQIYADKLNEEGKWEGAKLDVTNGGMYYTVGDKPFAERAVPENEIAVKGDIAEVEAAVSAITENVYTKDEVYNKSEVYNKEELDGKISGVFHFKGQKASVEELPTDAEIGDVWQVGDKEYAWNGTEWVELGTPVDLSAYATKDYVESAITESESATEAKIAEAKAEVEAEIEAAVEAAETKINELDEELSVVSSALTKEIADREAAIEEVSESVEDLEKKATTSAQTYEEATAMDLELGQIVYVKEGEEGPSGHTAGAYICTGKDGEMTLIQKLEATSGTGETPLDRIAALESKVGYTALPEDKTVTALVTELYNGHVIEGDDVEE